MSTNNAGRTVTRLTSIQQAQAGGVAQIKVDVGYSYKRIKVRCASINYSAAASGVAQTAVVLTKAGTPTATTFKPTIVNGVVTAVGTFGGTNTGWTVGDTFTYADATGIGAVFTVSVAGGGVMTAATVTSGGVQGPTNPAAMIGAVHWTVNGQTMWDCSAADIVGIRAYNFRPDKFGILPFDFAPPWNKNLGNPEINAADLTSQNSAQITLAINAGITSPAIYAVADWDLVPTVVAVGGKSYTAPQPLMRRAYSGIVLNAGQNDITTLPSAHPIDAIYVIGSTPGQIWEVDILNGSERRLEANALEAASLFGDYADGVLDTYTAPVAGGGFGQTTSSANQQSQHTLLADSPWLAADGIFPWDFVYKSAPDGRTRKALNVNGTLNCRIFSSIAQTARIVVDSFPGGFTGL